MIVLADHSMDWSTPDKVISLTAPLGADPLLAGKVQIACNGGADLLYWTGPDDQRAAAVARMREIAAQVPGVLSTHPTTDDWLRLGPEAGDVIAYCAQGWRFSDPNPLSSQPDPGQPRPPGHPPDPVLHRRRPPAGAARRLVAAARAHRRRGAHAGDVLRDPRRPQEEVRRALAALARQPRNRGAQPAGPAPCGPPSGSVVVHIGGRLALRKPP